MVPCASLRIARRRYLFHVRYVRQYHHHLRWLYIWSPAICRPYPAAAAATHHGNPAANPTAINAASHSQPWSRLMAMGNRYRKKSTSIATPEATATGNDNGSPVTAHTAPPPTAETVNWMGGCMIVDDTPWKNWRGTAQPEYFWL